MAGSDIVPDISCSSSYPVQEVKCDRNLYVNSRVQGCTRKMHHNSDDEPKERDDMLDNEKFVREIPDGCYCADVHPNQNCVHCPAGRDARICGVFQRTEVVCVP